MNGSSRVAVAIATSAALAVVALASCGIGSTNDVEELQPEELAALDQTTTSTTTTTVEIAVATEPEDTTTDSVESVPPHSGAVETSDATTTTGAPTSTTVPTETATLYFLDGSRLVGVDVEVEAPAELRRQLDALGAVPPDDFEAGIRTVVPAGLVHRVERWRNGITVDLNSEQFNGVESEDQRTMVAQIVLTLTAQPNIEEVLFTLDGEPLRVYRRDNVLSEPGEPVTREDYEELLAEEQPIVDT